MESTISLLNSINNGYDGLIRKITVQDLRSAEVEVSVSTLEQNWINVRFKMIDLKEFKIAQKLNTSNTVMSGGIKFISINDMCYLDFSPYSTEIDGVNDIRQSDIYFGAASIEWQVLPYSE